MCKPGARPCRSEEASAALAASGRGSRWRVERCTVSDTGTPAACPQGQLQVLAVVGVLSMHHQGHGVYVQFGSGRRSGLDVGAGHSLQFVACIAAGTLRSTAGVLSLHLSFGRSDHHHRQPLR